MRPAFGLTYDQVLEMVRRLLLHPKNARAVLRKSGYVGGAGVAASIIAWIAYGEYPFFEDRPVLPYDGGERPVNYPSWGNTPFEAPGPEHPYPYYHWTIGHTGLWRVQGSLNLANVLDAEPSTFRLRAVARGSDGSFRRAALMDQQFFASEPRGFYTPPGSFTRRIWEGTAEVFARGAAVLYVAEGERLGVEITITRMNGNDPPHSETLSGQFHANHLWLEYLGA